MSSLRDKARRRAENQVWTAAGAYGFLPSFLVFHHDGTPDAYLNAIVGFTHRFYEAEVLVAWLDGLRDSVFADTFTDLAWLGIEAAVYPQALAVAPALEALRREHAERFLADLRDVDLSMQQRMLQTGVAQTLKAARCHEVLGGRSGLRNPWDRGLYEALELPPQPSAEALTEALDAVLHRFFRFRFRTGARRAYHVVLPEMLHKFLRRVLPVHVVQDDAPTRQGGRGADRGVLGASGTAGGLARKKAEDWRQVCREAGRPFFPEETRARIEQDVCTGGHAAAHVYFARPDAGGADEARAANVAWAQAHAAVLKASERRIYSELKNVLDVMRQPLDVAAKQGRFSPRRAWRAAALGDGRVFRASEAEISSPFDVTLLLDASASREAQQPQIAAEAAMAARTLQALGIPVQVWSFASMHGVTVMTALLEMGSARTDGIYGYRARGWNRDGLALRAVEAVLGGAREGSFVARGGLGASTDSTDDSLTESFGSPQTSAKGQAEPAKELERHAERDDRDTESHGRFLNGIPGDPSGLREENEGGAAASAKEESGPAEGAEGAFEARGGLEASAKGQAKCAEGAEDSFEARGGRGTSTNPTDDSLTGFFGSSPASAKKLERPEESVERTARGTGRSEGPHEETSEHKATSVKKPLGHAASLSHQPPSQRGEGPKGGGSPLYGLSIGMKSTSAGARFAAGGAGMFSRRRHVVLMLTDAHPGDDLGLWREGAPVSRAYMGEAAVEDAAQAARELRARGVRLVGLVESVFPGEETDGAARRIFGEHFVRVHGVEALARKAGKVVAEEIGKE